LFKSNFLEKKKKKKEKKTRVKAIVPSAFPVSAVTG